jgi:hypothetical protein
MAASPCLNLRRTFQATVNYIRLRKELAVAVAAILAGMGYLLSKIADQLVEFLKGRTGASTLEIYGALFFVLAVILGLFILRDRGQITRKSEPWIEFDLMTDEQEQLRVVPVTSDEILVSVQNVVRLVFEEETPPDEEIFASFKINNRRSVALYDAGVSKYVGFASIWPVRDDVAEKIMNGEISEKEFKTEYMLPSNANQDANYALIPGVAVLDAGSAQGIRRARVLMAGFREFILKEFLAKQDREMTIFATAYSPAGEKWCKGLGMELKSVTNTAPHRPIYARKISAATLRPSLF